MLSFLWLVPMVVVLYGPGLVVGYRTGLRGLALIAMAPLFIVAVVGVTGPAFRILSVPFRWWTVATVAVVLGWVVVWAAGRSGGAAAPVEAMGRRHTVLGVVAAGLVAAVPVVRSLDEGLHTIPQAWDATTHLNLIAHIVTTGIGDWTSWVQVPVGGSSHYYPVAYHGVAAVFAGMTGQNAVVAFDALVVLTPIHLAISVGALAARFGGRSAALTAAAVVGSTSFAIDLDLGTQPFIWGLVLLPTVVLAFLLLDQLGRVAGWFWVATGVAALYTLQPSSMAAWGVFVGAWLLAAPVPWRRRVRRALALALVGVVVAVLCLPVTLAGLLPKGSSSVLANVAAFSTSSQWGGHRAVLFLLFWTVSTPTAGVVGAVLALVGAVVALTRRSQVWLALAFAGFALLVAQAAVPTRMPLRFLTGLWYNDVTRLASLYVVVGSVLAGVGLSAVLSSMRTRSFRWAPGVAVVASVGVIGALAYAYPDNRRVVGLNYRWQALSRQEATVLDTLSRWVGPGQIVLNDPWQGSTMLYPLTGIEASQEVYGDGKTPAEDLLLRHFDELATNRAVRAAIVQYRVCALYLGTGAIVPKGWTWSGFDQLGSVPDLKEVYSDPSSRIYVITGDLAKQAGCGAAGGTGPG